MKEQDREPTEPSIGQSILERLRTETNEALGDFEDESRADPFKDVYLTPRDTAVPDAYLGDDLLLDIRELYARFLWSIADELRSRHIQAPAAWIAVDPSYEDTTVAVLGSGEELLYLHVSKAWNFHWPDEASLARELEDIYGRAEQRLTERS